MRRLRRKECKAILSVITIMIAVILLGDASVAKAAGEINVQYHTKKEILEYFETMPVNYLTASYTTAPSTTQPYAAGELKQEVLEDALAMMKRVRFLAGLSTDIILDSSYTHQAQAASLVNAVNGSLSHSPSKPDGMDDTLYQLGKSGAGSSNIALGYSTLASAVLNAWMEDSDSSNIDRVGHRRWVLNPGMKKVGFGDVYGKYYNWNMHYQAMYAFDNAFNYTGQPSVWPAQVMPVEYFSSVSAWSYSTGTKENASAVQVVLTNETQNKSWSFSASSADGYFNVQNSNYGLPGCIIFRPQDYDSLYKAGDVYKVNITGLSQGDVSYHVSFFSLDTPFQITYDANGGAGSMNNLYVKLGAEYTLPKCDYTAPDGMVFDGWEIGAEKHQPGESITVSDDVTIKAVWKYALSVAYAHTCTVGNDLSLNYYIDAAALTGYDNLRLVVEKKKYNADGSSFELQSKTITDYSYGQTGLNGENEYKFRYTGLFAYEMGDELFAKVLADREGVTYESNVDQYSIKTYALNNLKRTTLSDELRTLLVDMLNYGAEAQIYFKYNTNNLVNRELTDEMKGWGTTGAPELTSQSKKVKNDNATSWFNGHTLIAGSNIELKYYMKFNAGVKMANVSFRMSYVSASQDQHELVIPAGAFQYDSENDEYSCKISTISTKDFGSVITAGIYDGDTLISETDYYSIGSYINNQLNKDTVSDELKVFLAAMGRYAVSARNYFSSNKS